MPKLEDRLAAAELKFKQLKAQAQRADAKKRSIALKNERSQEVRRNVLVGAIVRAKVEAGEIPTSELTHWLESRLTRDDDRELFGLAPKFELSHLNTTSDTKNTKSAATTE